MDQNIIKKNFLKKISPRPLPSKNIRVQWIYAYLIYYLVSFVFTDFKTMKSLYSSSPLECKCKFLVFRSRCRLDTVAVMDTLAEESESSSDEYETPPSLRRQCSSCSDITPSTPLLTPGIHKSYSFTSDTGTFKNPYRHPSII